MSVQTKKRLRSFRSGAAAKILPESLWTRRWRSFLRLFASTLRLIRAALWLPRAALFVCSLSSASQWRSPRLSVGALPSFSRAARFARRSARRRRTVRTHCRWRSLFPTAALAFRCAHWRRSAEALTFRSVAAILRRDILITTRGTRTLAQPARWWSTMFRWRRRWTERGWRWRGHAGCSSRVGCRAWERRSPAWSTFAAFKWRRRQACCSRRRCRDSGSWPSTGHWFPSFKW